MLIPWRVNGLTPTSLTPPPPPPRYSQWFGLIWTCLDAAAVLKTYSTVRTRTVL